MRIRAYMAASVDGYIADSKGGISWLDRYNSVEVGEAAFMADLGTVVVGRTTFDQMLGFPGGWAFPGKRGIVVSSREIDRLPNDVERWTASISELIERLRGDPDERAAWIVGGASLQAAFLAAGAIDMLDLFVIPVEQQLTLVSAEALGLGMVHLKYEIGSATG